MVMLLLTANANIESKDGDGWTPPWQAAWKRHKAIFKLLLEAKPDVESKEWRWLDAAVAGRQEGG
jgi:ankyrin repeat protein